MILIACKVYDIDNFACIETTSHHGDIAHLLNLAGLLATAPDRGLNASVSSGKLYFASNVLSKKNFANAVRQIVLEFAGASPEHPVGLVNIIGAEDDLKKTVTDALVLGLTYQGDDIGQWAIGVVGWHGDRLQVVLRVSQAENALIKAGYQTVYSRGQFGQRYIVVRSRYEKGSVYQDGVTIAEIVMPFLRADHHSYVLLGLQQWHLPR